MIILHLGMVTEFVLKNVKLYIKRNIILPQNLEIFFISFDYISHFYLFFERKLLKKRKY